MHTRWAHFKGVFSKWWATVNALWALASSADAIVGKFASQDFKDAWDKSVVTPKWGWTVWSIGFLIITTIFAFEYSYKLVRNAKSESATWRDALQSTGPEILMAFHPGTESLKDDYFMVRHTGGGSVRNIQIGDVSDGNWVGKSELIPYLDVSDFVEVKTKFIPVTPEAIEASRNGGYMRLDAFVMRSLNGIKNLVTVTHEDAASLVKCETDWEIVCNGIDYKVTLIQKGRRVKPLAALPPSPGVL